MLRSGVPKDVKMKARSNKHSANVPTRPPPTTDAESHPEIAEFLDDLRDLGIGDLESPASEDKAGQRTVAPPTHEAPSLVGGAQAGEDCNKRDLTAAEVALDEEWVPLEMYFGIPLFNEEANKAVCEKVRMEQ